MGRFEGAIVVGGLPVHRGLIISLCFFRVERAGDLAPYGGNPPGKAVTDSHTVMEEPDLESESSQSTYDLPFAVERPTGFYFLQVRAILFRIQAGKAFAQAEQFFFTRRPLPITEEPLIGVTLPVQWPQIPLEELHSYGVVEPRGG